MKKALVFITNNDYMGIEVAINKSREGYEPYFILCDSSVRGCNVCRTFNKAQCMLCNYQMKRLIRSHVSDGIPYTIKNVSDLITKEDKKNSSNVLFEYDDVSSLKDITFHDVEIGYGAFSTFVSFTRNIMPKFNEELKGYINKLMRSEILLTLVLERCIKDVSPDIVVFHNGRFANLKPIYCIAQKNGIDYIVTEQITKSDGEVLKNNFFNEIPHSFLAIDKKIEKAWINAGEKGANIGKEFYENRKNAKPAGDKVYTKEQIAGCLPEDFDSRKRNIAIFNSSEDEFFAISKEYDKAVLFTNQYQALRTIFEHYKNDNSIHFYLRIHPNLKTVPWKSHTLLYELKYDNVTIIPPTSPISSYALMESSEKVIVFNSTMGVESSYWGKPVIALNRCFYSCQGLVYEPSDKQELYGYIDDQKLPSLRKENNCYKVACYCMGYAGEHYENFEVKSYRLDHGVEVMPLLKIFGSAKIYAFLSKALFVISVRFGKYKNLAKRTA